MVTKEEDRGDTFFPSTSEHAPQVFSPVSHGVLFGDLDLEKLKI